jgi:plasmid stabilization system protein ParE
VAFRVQEAASLRIDEIYRYTADHWAAEHAESYINGLFEAFARIEGRGVASKPVPAEFGVDGFYFKHRHYFVYWRRLADGEIGIVTVLRERKHQIERFRDDLSNEPPVPD